MSLAVWAPRRTRGGRGNRPSVRPPVATRRLAVPQRLARPGAVYASAADLTARATGVDGRAYMINAQHLIAAGAFDAAPGHAWIVDRVVCSRPRHGQLFIMIDKVGVDAAGQLVDEAPGQRLDQLRRAAPGSQLVGFFRQPDSPHGVAVPHRAQAVCRAHNPRRRGQGLGQSLTLCCRGNGGANVGPHRVSKGGRPRPHWCGTVELRPRVSRKCAHRNDRHRRDPCRSAAAQPAYRHQ